MTPIDRFERHLPDGLTDLASPQVPGYLDDILADTARKRQRPAWSFLERWLPMTLVLRRPATAPPLRASWVLVLASLLALALVGTALVAGSAILSSRPPTGARALPPTNCPAGTPLPSGTIATIAGTGVAGASGDGGPATAATIQMGQGLAIDDAGNLYFGDSAANAVRRIRPDGVIETFASGLTAPSGMAFDAAGNLYVKVGLFTIKRIDPAGSVTTFAGTGVDPSTLEGADGDGGPAIDAQIGAATLAIGPDGSLYFDDYNRYRTIDPAGMIRTFAGTGATGFSGDGGPATDATFGNFQFGTVGVAVAADGSVYLGDGGNYRIRKVDPSGTISTTVGSGLPGHTGDGGKAMTPPSTPARTASRSTRRATSTSWTGTTPTSARSTLPGSSRRWPATDQGNTAGTAGPPWTQL